MGRVSAAFILHRMLRDLVTRGVTRWRSTSARIYTKYFDGSLRPPKPRRTLRAGFSFLKGRYDGLNAT